MKGDEWKSGFSGSRCFGRFSQPVLEIVSALEMDRGLRVFQTFQVFQVLREGGGNAEKRYARCGIMGSRVEKTRVIGALLQSANRFFRSFQTFHVWLS
jgi:hypothetical protein